MFIKKSEYEELKNTEKLNAKLEEEVKRLSSLISAEVKDCDIGPWCNRCQHLGVESAEVVEFTPAFGFTHVVKQGGKVFFCLKHIHSLCPEFEGKRTSR